MIPFIRNRSSRHIIVAPDSQKLKRIASTEFWRQPDVLVPEILDLVNAGNVVLLTEFFSPTEVAAIRQHSIAFRKNSAPSRLAYSEKTPDFHFYDRTKFTLRDRVHYALHRRPLRRRDIYAYRFMLPNVRNSTVDNAFLSYGKASEQAVQFTG